MACKIGVNERTAGWTAGKHNPSTAYCSKSWKADLAAGPTVR